MKKITFTLLFMAAMALTFTGCNNAVTDELGTTAADEQGSTVLPETETMPDSNQNNEAEDNSGILSDPDNATTGTSSDSTLITEDAAKQYALSHAGLAMEDVTFTKSSIESEDGRQVYDVEFHTKDNKEYEVPGG